VVSIGIPREDRAKTDRSRKKSVLEIGKKWWMYGNATVEPEVQKIFRLLGIFGERMVLGVTGGLEFVLMISAISKVDTKLHDAIPTFCGHENLSSIFGY